VLQPFLQNTGGIFSAACVRDPGTQRCRCRFFYLQKKILDISEKLVLICTLHYCGNTGDTAPFFRSLKTPLYVIKYNIRTEAPQVFDQVQINERWNVDGEKQDTSGR
jgi:hypothetical protein